MNHIITIHLSPPDCRVFVDDSLSHHGIHSASFHISENPTYADLTVLPQTVIPTTAKMLRVALDSKGSEVLARISDPQDIPQQENVPIRLELAGPKDLNTLLAYLQVLVFRLRKPSP